MQFVNFRVRFFEFVQPAKYIQTFFPMFLGVIEKSNVQYRLFFHIFLDNVVTFSFACVYNYTGY